MQHNPATPSPKKRQSGIPTGNAGEYFVMGELLRRGYDAQLADRNTKAYDVLVGRQSDKSLRKVQVKSVRSQPWFVSLSSFTDENLDEVTIYVLLGKTDGRHPVRYFISRNRDLIQHVARPAGWRNHAFMPLKAVEPFEGRWDLLESA